MINIRDLSRCQYTIQILCELLYRTHACEFDETRVHDDYSVIGSEFCDFLSSLLTYKMINHFDEHNLFDTMNYKKIMKMLERAKKVNLPNKGASSVSNVGG